MTTLLVSFDADLCGHLAVALRRHRSALNKNGLAEPPELADLEDAAVEIVTRTQQASVTVSVPTVDEDDCNDRAYLTRSDVHRLTGASLSTVDRWVRSGDLPSCKHGGIRRIARTDLQRFLAAA